MKNYEKGIIGLFLIIILALAVYKTVQEDKVVTETVSTPTYKEIAKEQFMGECVSDGLYAYCDCAFETLYAKLGAEGFIKLANEFDTTGELPEGTMNTIDKCFSKIDR